MINRIASIEIQGFRGFANAQRLDCALNNGLPGSGLTIVVGPNNGGKSTVMEAVRLFGKGVRKAPSVAIGKRNKEAGDCVTISLILERGHKKVFKSRESGGSECEFTMDASDVPEPNIYALPSRRVFAQFFGAHLFDKGPIPRMDYIGVQGSPIERQQSLMGFENRLLNAQRNRQDFNKLLSRVIDPVPDWTVDRDDRGDFFVKIRTGSHFHNSEGIGDGLLSLFFIIDALYDSQPNDVIVIDEPELSLHPALQKKLAMVLQEYAAERQIIIATHSPYFVDFDAIGNGAKVARVTKSTSGSRIHTLSMDTSKKLAGFLNDKNNPHVIGLSAREIFFLEDRIILLEGQEDVIFYKLLEQHLGKTLQGDFYGWGVGGADKMGIIAAMLKDLGFSKVVGVLDKNKGPRRDKLAAQFSEYSFFLLPADDVRSKEERPAKSAVDGILDMDSEVQPRHRANIESLFEQINDALR